MKSTKEELSDKLRTLLLEEYNRRREKNSRYSLKAFAKSIGGSDSYIQRLFSGKRNISYKRFLEFAKKGNISEASVLSLVRKHNKDLKKIRIFEAYTQEQYKILDNVKASTLLTIIRVLRVKQDYAELANLRDYTKEEVRNILDTALKVNLVYIDENGYIVNHSSRIMPIKMDEEAERLRIVKLNQAHEHVGCFLKSELKGNVDPTSVYHAAMSFAHYKNLLKGKNRKYIEEEAGKFFGKLSDASQYKNAANSSDDGAVYMMTFNVVRSWAPEKKGR